MLSAVHELGHTLGMGHDPEQGCTDDDGTFIMAAVGCGNCSGAEQAEFSPCSVAEFQAFLAGPAYAGTPGAAEAPSGRMLDALGWLALAVVPLWRRRRRR